MNANLSSLILNRLSVAVGVATGAIASLAMLAALVAGPAAAQPLPLADLPGQPAQLCGPSASFSGTIAHAETRATLGDDAARGVWVLVVVDLVNDGPDRSWLFNSAQLVDDQGRVVRNDGISSRPPAAASALLRVRSQESYLDPGERARVVLVFDVAATATAFEFQPIFDYCR